MAITVYGGGLRFPQITPDSFVLVYNTHWIDFPRYRDSPLYHQADVALRTMITNKKRMPRPFIASDIEIKGILGILGRPFIDAYSTYGFTVNCAAMIGMQLFEIFVHDHGFNWWYRIPKPSRGIGHYDHSEYHL